MKKTTVAVLLCACLTALAAGLLCSCQSQENDPVVSDSRVVSKADIIINEVLTSNSESAKAFDGRYYDWVELYNPTPDTVVLDNYYLSDNIEDYQKASLKGQRIAPGGYLIVYCSGLNMTDEKGFLHTRFKLSAEKGETLYLTDGVALSELEIPAAKENVSYGLDASGENYVWYDVPTPGKPNTGRTEEIVNYVIINEYMTSNTFTVYDCESDYGDWVELFNTGSQAVDLGGYGLTDNDENPFKYVFPDGASIEAGQYLLVWCDGKNKTDESGAFHTNFSLGREDAVISLYRPENLLACTIAVIPNMPDNISCGLAEGESEPKLFARPTPGRKNTTAWTELSASPTPDVNDGVLISETLSASNTSWKYSKYKTDYIEIYNSTSGSVNLKGYTLAQKPGEVFFTFPSTPLEAGEYVLVWCDGTKKASNPANLHAPIKISTGGEDFYLANASGRVCDVYASGKGRFGMSSGRVGGDVSRRVFFAEPTPGAANSSSYYIGFAPAPTFSVEGGVVKKGTKVSLSAPEGFKIVYTLDGSKPTASSAVYKSPIAVKKNTVIRAAAVGKKMAISECVTQTYLIKNPHTIPIVCVSGDKSELTGNVGILTNQHIGAEYEVHCEYFDEQGVKAVEFECGAKHFGAYSLKLDEKGLRLALRERYGQNSVSYNFFNENDKAATTFTSLLLRPSGQDQARAKLRDEVIPAIIRGQMDIDYQEYRACALYINGAYWGLYYIRERLDGDYLKSYYGFEDGSFDLIKSQLFVQEGSMKQYTALTEYCKKNDLTVQSNYDYLCSIVDMDSLIHYWILETYFGNFDTGNIRCYKEKNGKWRWMVYDFDWAMHSRKTMESKNYIDDHLLDPNGHGAANFDNAIIRNLLKNDTFRDRFITLYCYHIQHTFAPERTVPILNAMADTIDNEMKLNEARWKKPEYKTWKETNVPFLRTFLESKPDIAYRQLKSSFSLSQNQLEAYKQRAAQMTSAKDLP